MSGDIRCKTPFSVMIQHNKYYDFSSSSPFIPVSFHSQVLVDLNLLYLLNRSFEFFHNLHFIVLIQFWILLFHCYFCTLSLICSCNMDKTVSFQLIPCCSPNLPMLLFTILFLDGQENQRLQKLPLECFEITSSTECQVMTFDNP